VVLVDSKLNMNLQCALAGKKANSVQDCINSSKANILEGVIIFLCSALLRWHAEYCLQFCPAWYEEEIDQMERVQQKARNMNNSWSNCPVKTS